MKLEDPVGFIETIRLAGLGHVERMQDEKGRARKHSKTEDERDPRC